MYILGMHPCRLVDAFDIAKRATLQFLKGCRHCGKQGVALVQKKYQVKECNVRVGF